MAKDRNINIVLGVSTDELRKGFEDAIKSTKKGTDVIESEVKQMADGLVRQMEKVGNSTSLKQTARQMEALAGQMSKFGLTGTAAFNEVVSKTGELKAELDDVKGFIDAARPDAPFRALSTTLQASAQAFAGVQGAMALFGAESENTQKILLKVQAALALSEGFKAIDGLKDGFAQVGMVLKARVIPAVTSFVTSLGVLKTALIATGIGAFLVAIGAVVSALADEEEQANATAGALEDLHAANDKGYKELITTLGGIDELNKKAHKSDAEIYKAKLEFINDYIDKLEQQNRTFKDDKTTDQILNAEYLKYKLTDEFEGRKTKSVKTNVAERININTGGIDAERAINEELETINKSALAVQLIELRRWYDEKMAILTASGINAVNLTKLYVLKVANAIRDGQEKINPLGIRTPKTKPDKIQTIPSDGLYSTENARKTEANIDKSISAFDRLKMAMGEVTITAQEMNRMITTSISAMATELAAALGESLAGAKNFGDAFGDIVLKTVFAFMETLGQAMITTGVAAIAFDLALTSLNGYAAVAAGLALVVAASYAKTTMQKGPDGYASGGIVDGAFYTGDKVPIMVNAGEMVLNESQQSNLFKMLNGTTKRQEVRIVGDNTIKGKDLYTIFKMAEKDATR